MEINKDFESQRLSRNNLNVPDQSGGGDLPKALKARKILEEIYEKGRSESGFVHSAECGCMMYDYLLLTLPANSARLILLKYKDVYARMRDMVPYSQFFEQSDFEVPLRLKVRLHSSTNILLLEDATKGWVVKLITVNGVANEQFDNYTEALHYFYELTSTVD